MDCRRYRRNHPESMSISGCMFKPGAQKHWWPVLKHGTLSLMSFNNTDLWNRFGRPRRGDLNNNRLELTQVLQPSLSALSASAPCSIVFILLHYLTWSIYTNLTFSALMKLASNLLPPLLNFWTALLHTTPWSALPVMAPTRTRPLAVAQLFLSASHSHSYPPLFSFESSFVTLQLSHSKISLSSICRPPSSSSHSKPFSVFLDDFSSFVSFAATTPHEFIITGDFNVHLDNPACRHCHLSVSVSSLFFQS